MFMTKSCLPANIWRMKRWLQLARNCSAPVSFHHLEICLCKYKTIVERCSVVGALKSVWHWKRIVFTTLLQLFPSDKKNVDPKKTEVSGAAWAWFVIEENSMSFLRGATNSISMLKRRRARKEISYQPCLFRVVFNVWWSLVDLPASRSIFEF